MTVKPGLFLEPFVLMQLVGSVMAEITQGCGFIGADFAVASSLYSWEDATPTEVARVLGMSPTTLSAVLKRLEERGQLTRRRDRTDGRRSIVALTAKGRSACDKAYERFPLWMQAVRDELGVHPDEVLEPMRRLEQALRAVLDQSTSANSASDAATARKVHGPPSRGQR